MIRTFAQMIEEEQANCDCAVVIVLSHGGNGKIYAVDELPLDVRRSRLAERRRASGSRSG